MKRAAPYLLLALSLIFTAGCDDDDDQDPLSPDAGAVVDTGTLDVEVDAAITVDAALVADAELDPDTGGLEPDAAPQPEVPHPGFGMISGGCGVIDEAMLNSAQPYLIRNVIDFGDDPYDPEDEVQLTAGGLDIVIHGNAGGDSILSEAFSFEVLARCEDATLVKRETEIVYFDAQGKITDILVEMDDLKVGVSVTRAMSWPRDEAYLQDQAASLLQRKLEGVLESSANVVPDDAWVKQVLHIIADTEGHADVMTAAYETMDAALKADTILMLTVSEGADDFLY